jgi:5-methylcytosine-specific restriction endonuclease McrA
MLSDPTLVLNRSWVAITTTTVQSALSLVYRGAARVIQPETYETYDFQTWAELRVAETDRVIRTVHLSITVPEVILLTRHDRMPARLVPFSRRNLYRRDSNSCQYCGRVCSTRDLSIDHVIPRSRGGKTNWENCVLACIPCNVRKGNRSLEQVGMRLIKHPIRPTWSPCLTVKLGRRLASWERFVSDHYWNVTLDED